MVSIAITVWVTLRAAYPKRRLFYGMPVVTPLLNASDDVREGIEIRRGGRLLADPQVVKIDLISQSRLDISNQHFNTHRPLRLDVGAPIVEILKVATRPSDREMPKVKIDGTGLEVGPSLIGKRQAISLFLLLDGPEPSLNCLHPPLIDVDVRELKSDSLARPAFLIFAILITVAGLGLIPIGTHFSDRFSFSFRFLDRLFLAPNDYGGLCTGENLPSPSGSLLRRS